MADDLLAPTKKQPEIQYYIAKYFTPVLDNVWYLVACSIIGVLLALPLSMLTHPEYNSSATVMVEEPRAKMVSKVTEKISVRPASKAYILAEAEKMKSGFFMGELLKILPEQTLKDLDVSLEFRDQILSSFVACLKRTPIAFLLRLVERKGNDNAQQKDDRRKAAIRLINLAKRIDIRTKTSSGLVKITATATNPESAMIIVKSFLDVWSALNLEENKRYIKRELNFAKEQRKIYLAQLKRAEDELQQFKKKYEIPPMVTSVTDSQIESRLEVLYSKVESAKERYKKLDEIFLELNRKEKTIVNNIRVVKMPPLPRRPSRSIKSKIILIGFAIGVAMGIAPVLLWDYYNGTIRHERDITDTLDLPIIGEIPPL